MSSLKRWFRIPCDCLNCPFRLNPAYSQDVYIFLTPIFERANRVLGYDNDTKTEFRLEADHSQFVIRCDRKWLDITGSYALVPLSVRQYMTQKLYQTIFGYLMEFAEDRDRSKDLVLSFLFSCAINMKSVDAVNNCLQSFPESSKILPECAMSSLLCQAIRDGFLEGLKALLINGFPSVSKWRRVTGAAYWDELPLSVALDVLPPFIEQSEDVEKVMVQCEIAKLLVNSGADVSFFHEEITNIDEAAPIFRISMLPLESQSLKDCLIKATSSTCLMSARVCQCDFDDNAAFAPLGVALRIATRCHFAASYCGTDRGVNIHLEPEATHISSKYERLFQRQAEWVNDIISHGWIMVFADKIASAVLPLLRAGAKLNPDPLKCNPLYSANLLPIFGSSPGTETLDRLLWGRQNAFAELIFELRQTSSLPSCYENNLRWDHLQAHLDGPAPRRLNVCPGCNIRASFPRTLQSMCRIAILKCLPVGACARANAISELNLPRSLISYLNFSEFNLTCSFSNFNISSYGNYLWDYQIPDELEGDYRLPYNKCTGNCLNIKL